MTTARDLIEGAFRLIGVYESGENPSADEMNDALYSLNELKDTLNLSNLMSYDTLSATYPFVGNQASYVLGLAGDFNIAIPPVEITKVTIRDINNALDLPCTILTSADYADIILKDLESQIPFCVLINQEANNTKTLIFWPVPTSASYGVTIYYQTFVGTFALDTTIVLPPGYKRMFRYNLATEIAAEYGIPVSSDIDTKAKDSLADVKRQNLIPQTIGVDRSIPSGNNRNRSSYYDVIIGA
mgnify:CR=1 FL=1